MASTSSSDQSATLKEAKGNDKDGSNLQNATHAAANALQKPSGSRSVDLTTSDAANPTDETNVREVAGDPESSPAKRLKFHNNNPITVVVGAEKARFTIHRGPTCKASAYFKALFESSFKESSEKAVPIEEHMPETFDLFLKFAYSHNTYLSRFRDLDSEGNAWGTADYSLDAPGLKTAILREVFVQVKIAKLEKKSAGVTAEVIDYIYANTTRECKLRRLIVAQHGKLNSGHMFQPIQILRGFSEV